MHVSSAFAKLKSVLASVAIFGLGLLGACGGGSGSMSSTSSTPTSTPSACSNCGAAVVTITDAPGDFLSYMVNLTSLKLTRSDGTVVEMVPATTQVDFANLVNLSEVFTAKQIPEGSYTSASMTIDFSGATIVVDNGTTGVTIAPSNVINGSTSLPLATPNPTTMTLNLSLPAGSPLVVTRGTIANLALDFNLLASNTVAPSNTNPTTVTVNPVITASLTPDATKQLHVRGGFVSADTTAGSYVVDLHPFSDDNDDDGQLTVLTTAQTTYAINGTSFTGAAGLAALAALAPKTMTSALGTWDVAGKTFTASSVQAGSSVVGAMHDGVEGTVIARAGNTLTLANGGVHQFEHSGMSYARQVTVTIGASTTVTALGSAAAFSIQDISVGQLVQVSGTLAQSTSTSGATRSIDATSGSVTLVPTPVVGVVRSVAANVVTLNLQSLGGVDPAMLDFTGTGTSSATDASATAYTVSLPAALSTSGIGSGAPLRLLGLVAPFGTAPPDFTASTVVDYAQSGALLHIRFAPPGNNAPFASLAATGLAISQATVQASAEHTLQVGPLHTDPAVLTSGISLVPDAAAATTLFAIVHETGQAVDTFTTFTDFEAALATDLNGTNAVVQLLAQGPFNNTTGALSVDKMVVILGN